MLSNKLQTISILSKIITIQPFKHLEQKHNALKDVVKSNTLLITSGSWSNVRSEYEIFLSAIIVSFIYFGNS